MFHLEHAECPCPFRRKVTETCSTWNMLKVPGPTLPQVLGVCRRDARKVRAAERCAGRRSAPCPPPLNETV